MRSLDIYGHPINLTYKEHDTYKSVLGGAFTIISRLIVFIYLILELKSVSDKKSTITTTAKIINTATDTIQYTLDQSMFDFAVNINYLNAQYEPKVMLNLH